MLWRGSTLAARILARQRAGLALYMQPSVVASWKRWNSSDPKPNGTTREPSFIPKVAASEEQVPGGPRVENEGQVDQTDVVKTTGRVDNTATEGLLYFDHLYPPFTRMSNVLVRWLGFAISPSKPELQGKLVQHSIPSRLPIEIIGIIPREKDGGAFLRYKILSSELTQTEVENAVEAQLVKNPVQFWYDYFHKVRFFSVKGTPWIEDLQRFVTNRVRVTFEGPDLSQETLYSIFRRYGPINDIIPPPPGFKDTPRSTLILFSRFYDAGTARNCVTGMVVGDTKIHVSFEPLAHRHVIRSFFMDHPRITVPIIVALLAALAVLIFEPIRVFFIRAKICGSMSFDKYPIISQARQLWKSMNRTFDNYMGLKRAGYDEDPYGANRLWDERLKSVQTLRQWIQEGVGTFIVVVGPRGAGKEQLVMDYALRDRKDVLEIDCDALIRARTDNAFIKAASHQLGYFPVFPWMNSIMEFVDLAVQSLSGQKTGFSQDPLTQFRGMLSTSLVAVQRTALENKKSTGAEESSDESYLQLHPEDKPVIVIRGFLSRADSPRTAVYKHVAEWAAQLIQSNTAHVVFITSDLTYAKLLSDALPNQVFKDLNVGDASISASRTYITNQVGYGTNGEQQTNDEKPSVVLDGLDDALGPLGGRMTDLQAFARRLKSGETPAQALKDMVSQSAVEILQMFLMKSSAEWTREQVWTLIKKLAALPSPDGAVPLTELALDANYKTREQQHALHVLEHNEMIWTHTVGGRILSVKPGKPLYHAAFKALVNDKSLYSTMEMDLLTRKKSGEEASIKSCEEELRLLAGLPKRWETNARVDYLATKLYSSQMAVKKYETDIARHKAVLAACA